MKTKFLKMLTISIAISVLALPGNGLFAQQSTLRNDTDTLRLTLDEALTIAMSENLTVKIAGQEVQKQQYAKKGTYASLFPQVDFSGGFQYTIEKQTMYMDGIPGMEEGMKVGRDNLWNLGFSAGMPLISVPLWKSLKISAYDVELALEKARASRIDLREQVQKAFYTSLLADDAHRVFKEVYQNALDNYNEIKRKYDQGLVAEYDLVRAEVNLKNAEPNLYDAENTIILTRWQLKAILGLDLEQEIKCTGSLADYESSLVSAYDPGDLSLSNNSVLKQLDVQVQQLKRVEELQKAQYYPSLSAQFSYQWIAMNNNFKFKDYKLNPYSIAGLSLSIPIFSGGKRLSEVKKAQVMTTQLKLQRTDVERQLAVAIRQAADQMSTCRKQYGAAKAGVAQAEKGYMITMKRYETGEGTLLEINDSQLHLTQARLNLNQSIYNYLVAVSSLEKTLGKEYEN